MSEMCQLMSQRSVSSQLFKEFLERLCYMLLDLKLQTIKSGGHLAATTMTDVEPKVGFSIGTFWLQLKKSGSHRQDVFYKFYNNCTKENNTLKLA